MAIYTWRWPVRMEIGYLGWLQLGTSPTRQVWRQPQSANLGVSGVEGQALRATPSAMFCYILFMQRCTCTKIQLNDNALVKHIYKSRLQWSAVHYSVHKYSMVRSTLSKSSTWQYTLYLKAKNSLMHCQPTQICSLLDMAQLYVHFCLKLNWCFLWRASNKWNFSSWTVLNCYLWTLGLLYQRSYNIGSLIILTVRLG